MPAVMRVFLSSRSLACLLALLLCFGVLQPGTALARSKKLVTHTHAISRVPAPAFNNYQPGSNAYNSGGRFATLIINAATGEVLHQENADAPRKPASLTKMMTLYLTFQALEAGRIHLDSMLPVSQLAASQSPTKLDLRPGQRITVENAVLGLVTESANDAAVVLAEGVGGNIDRFAGIMTQTARKLGMSSTTYRNPNGLPVDGQYTTARDQARLALALLRHYPQYYHYFSTPSFAYGGRMHPNHNHLMERYEGMDGIKTGYIRDSGFNLVASVKRGNTRLIGVIFGGPSAYGRDNQLAALLDAAFAQSGSSGGSALPRTQEAQAPQAQSVPRAAQLQPTPQPAPREVTSSDADIVAQVQQRNQLQTQIQPQAQPQQRMQAQIQAETQAQVQAQGDTNDEPQVEQPASFANKTGTLQLPQAQSAQPQTAPVQTADAQPAAKPAAKVVSANGKSGEAGGWGIQIGAYNDRASGQRATAMVADGMPDLLRQADAKVLSVTTATGTIYRARLIGLSETAARTACSRLQAKDKPCMMLPPARIMGSLNGDSNPRT